MHSGDMRYRERERESNLNSNITLSTKNIHYVYLSFMYIGVCVCVNVNSCALRTSQGPISFVSLIPQPSRMLEMDNRIWRRQSTKKTAKLSKEKRGDLLFSVAHFQEIGSVFKNICAFNTYTYHVDHEMVKSGRGWVRRSVEFCKFWHCLSCREARKVTTSEILPVVLRSDLGRIFQFSSTQGVPGIIASLALTLICDIRKGTSFWPTCSFETVHQAVAVRLFR